MLIIQMIILFAIVTAKKIYTEYSTAHFVN